jgi:hypothetical protein
MTIDLSQKYELSESLAIARLTWDLIRSNSILEEEELDFLNLLLEELELEKETFNSYLNTPIEEVYSIVRTMVVPKKQECGRLLRMAVHSDGKIDLSELSELNSILEHTALFKTPKKDSLQSEGSF